MKTAFLAITLMLFCHTSSALADEHGLVADCEQGNAKACGFAGSHYQWGTGGFPTDHAKALEYQERGCAGGDADSCFGAGLLLTGSNAEAGSAARAVEFFAKGCKLGNDYACAHQQPGS